MRVRCHDHDVLVLLQQANALRLLEDCGQPGVIAVEDDVRCAGGADGFQERAVVAAGGELTDSDRCVDERIVQLQDSVQAGETGRVLVEQCEGGPVVGVHDVGERAGVEAGAGIEVAGVGVAAMGRAARDGCGRLGMGDDVGQAEFGADGGDDVWWV